ncbi:condensation domain-containing protein [Xanthomonas theicola]|uniref:condensation domain-containing protein n=1 Tax=Xanthomonas theicola TaxID=56464 RepID=UPI00361BBCFE
MQKLLKTPLRSTPAIQPRPRVFNAGPWRAPASRAQQRLWFIDRMGDAIRAYYMSVSLRFKGALDIETLQHALDALVARHESLRTTFVNVDGELFQEIAPQGRFYIGPSESCFDLETGPLIRGRLTQVCVDEHVLDITVHHIVSDAWSIGVLTRELIELYGALDTQREHRLPPVAVQYADYAHWVRQQDAIGPQLDYWRERLRGLPPDIDLPTDRPSPVAPTHRGESVELALDEALTARVKHLAQRHELTLYMVLCTAWAVLLSRISGHADIAVGTQVAGRARPEMEGTIGVFVNSLVLRVGVDANARVDELLQHVKAVTLGAYDHQDVPFDRVVEALQPPRSVTRNPLYQVMFVMTSTPRGRCVYPRRPSAWSSAARAMPPSICCCCSRIAAPGFRAPWTTPSTCSIATPPSAGAIASSKCYAPWCGTPTCALATLARCPRCSVGRSSSSSTPPAPRIHARSCSTNCSKNRWRARPRPRR